MNMFTVALVAALSTAVLPRTTTAPQDNTVPAVPAAGVPAARFVPFGVGERMDYEAKWGAIKAGTGAIEVRRLETIRGRPAWNLQLRITGGVPLVYRVNSVFESWMDTTFLHSLRYSSNQQEGGRNRTRYFEIFPERAIFRQRITPDTLPEMPSVSNPLDEASFLFFIRTTPLEVGQTYTYERYFRPDRNPVIIKVIGKEEIRVPAGRFSAIKIQPTIKANGIFNDGGEATVWLSDDPSRMLLRMDSKLPVGTLHLEMTKYTPPRGR